MEIVPLISKSARIEWLDALKALAIFLVTLGHVFGGLGHHDHFMRNFIYSFHMPLFFAISGYVAAYALVAKNGDVGMSFGEAGRFMRRKFHTLIFPYILVPLLLYPIFYGRIMDPEYFPSVVRSIFVDNTAAWFLSCLFLLMMVFAVIAIIHRRFERCPLCVLAVVMQGVIVGAHWLTGNPFIRSVVSYFLPFAVGMLVVGRERMMSRKCVWIPAGVVWIATGVVFAQLANSEDSHFILLSKVARLVAGTASIPALFAMFAGIAGLEGAVGRTVSHIGKCTLMIYLFQDFPISYAAIGNRLGANFPDVLLIVLCLVIACVVVVQGVCIDWAMRKSRVLSFLFLGRRWSC